MDDIVEHYKHKQIVEGHTLGQAIPKTMDISRECRVDIYETINRASNSEQAGSRGLIAENSVTKRGQLLKKGSKFCFFSN